MKTEDQEDAEPRHPEEIWLDADMEPEDLVRLDPLDVTDEIVELAEHPELADPIIRALPDPGDAQ